MIDEQIKRQKEIDNFIKNTKERDFTQEIMKRIRNFGVKREILELISLKSVFNRQSEEKI